MATMSGLGLSVVMLGMELTIAKIALALAEQHLQSRQKNMMLVWVSVGSK